MALDSNLPAAFDLIRAAERFYAALIPAAKAGGDAEPGLGGQMLYAGELDEEGRALVAASNIAGAASLAASADAAAQKQAIREGAVDFLVTNLDEALRILKNEIRKGQAVSVCVAARPQAMEREMVERGVRPDLLRPGATAAELETFLQQGARQIVPVAGDESPALLAWSVAAAPAEWLPRLDALALGCLRREDGAARRWLRLAPRYLGRAARGVRLLACTREFAAEFVGQVRAGVERGEIGVRVELSLTVAEQPERYSFTPPGR